MEEEAKVQNIEETGPIIDVQETAKQFTTQPAKKLIPVKNATQKPADIEGYEWKQYKSGMKVGQWYKSKIVSEEQRQAKKLSDKKLYDEKLMPARLEQIKQKKAVKEQQKLEQLEIQQKQAKVYDKTDQAVTEIRTVRDEINSLKQMISNVKLGTVIQQDQSKPQRPKSVQEILGIQPTSQNISQSPPQQQQVVKPRHKNPNLQEFGL